MQTKEIKISIITMHSSINYGSVLQTYATQKVFEKLGASVEFIDYVRNNITDQRYADRMQKRHAIRLLKKCTMGLLDKKINAFAIKKVKKRAKPMRDFLRKYIHLTEQTYYTFQSLKDNPPKADIYCTGSDQVWNSVWNGGIESPYYLEFVPVGKKRIAYAASIGRTDVDKDELATIVPLLNKYSSISMREKSGVELLKKANIDSEWVIDPTLMLSHSEWMEIAEPVSLFRRSYLLAYVLNWNKKIEKLARDIAKQNGLIIVRICKSRSSISISFGIKKIVVKSIGELLSYFDNATCILTDSFHATAFSLNFHKSFLVVFPERFSTRLDSILSLTQTEACKITQDRTSTTLPDIDWENVDNIIEIERKKATAFLINATNLAKISKTME